MSFAWPDNFPAMSSLNLSILLTIPRRFKAEMFTKALISPTSRVMSVAMAEHLHPMAKPSRDLKIPMGSLNRL